MRDGEQFRELAEENQTEQKERVRNSNVSVSILAMALSADYSS